MWGVCPKGTVKGSTWPARRSRWGQFVLMGITSYASPINPTLSTSVLSIEELISCAFCIYFPTTELPYGDFKRRGIFRVAYETYRYSDLYKDTRNPLSFCVCLVDNTACTKRSAHFGYTAE